MFQTETLIKQFSFGMSVLTAYLRYNNKINYQDINVLSEGFIRDLLNILFDLQLSKPLQQNSPGYDLISKNSKVVVQISTTCTPEKVKHTLTVLGKTISQARQQKKMYEDGLKDIERSLAQYTKNQLLLDGRHLTQKEQHLLAEKTRLEAEHKRLRHKISAITDIGGYRILFFFLSETADSVIKYNGENGFSLSVPSELSFCKTEDVLCFHSLIHAVQNLSQDSDVIKIEKLKKFMSREPHIFSLREPLLSPKHKVDQVIDEYANNFTSPLFLHQFTPGARVTLQNLFVEPSFSPVNKAARDVNPNNIIALLDSFAWDCPKDRLLFIDGDAAIGKTSLISWLCYHYRAQDDIGKAIFLNMPLVCVRLRDLAFTEDCSAEECVLKYLSFPDMGAFEQQYNNALIVLEGADELGIVSGVESIAIEQFVLDIRHAFSTHKIVITSRPKFITMSLLSGYTQTFSYQHYLLNHFSAEERASWLYNYEAEEKCGQSIPDGTKKYLQEMNDEEAAGVADTPLALYLMATCEITDTLRDNKWALYHEIFHKAIRDTRYNEAFHGSKTTLHKALQEDSFAETVYRIVGEIANKMFMNLKEERFYIHSSELDAIITNNYDINSKEQAKAVRKCCVLCAYWKEDTNTGALEFYHNNIRAFFMCEYIYQRFSNISLFPVSQGAIHQLIEIACEVFQHGIIARTTWVQTFSFLYYRLQHEKNDCQLSVAVTPSEQEVETLFSSIIHTIITSDTLWKYSFNGPTYESAKATFFNFTLFLRIWLSSYGIISSEKFDSLLRNAELFKDWIKIFSDNVEISSHKHIAFGSQMRFRNMVFEGEDLSGACFESSDLLKSQFKKTNLRSANFSGAHLENIVFSDADLHEADFSGATLINADFSRANLYDVDFSKATLVNVDFSSANLCQANFKNAMISVATWPKSASLFNSVDFTCAKISQTLWKSMKIKDAIFTGAFLEECLFQSVQFLDVLEEVTFSDCTITSTDFASCHNLLFSGKKTTLLRPRFCGEFSHCSFKDVTLSESDWSNSSLKSIIFTNVQINKGLTFRAAQIMNASFTDCSLDGNIDVRYAYISQSIIDYLKAQAAKILNLSSATVYTDDKLSK